MLRFSINVSMMLNEIGFLDRFVAAADLGFGGVDIQFPYEWDADEIAKKVESAGVQVVLLNLPAGDRSAGELGLAALPGREKDFRTGLERGLRYCKALNCQRVNVLPGVPPEGSDKETCTEVLVQNLVFALDRLGSEGIVVMVEPINGFDAPGFLIQSALDLAPLLERPALSGLKLQFDLYHHYRMGLDCSAVLRDFLPQIAHIQFADVPGRHEPGTGEIDFEAFFGEIEVLGYDGWVGAEYMPSGKTADSLGWYNPD